MDQLKVAVVGLGKMGLLHASILATIPEVNLVAVCDAKKLIAKFAAQLIGKKIGVIQDVYSLQPLGLDAVFITTPIPSHKKLIDAVLEQNINNVFVEKTLTSTYGDSRKLVEKVAKLKGVGMVGYQKRHLVTFKKGLELWQSGVIGEVTNFKAYSYSSDFIHLDEKQLSIVSSSRGGLLHDLGAHAISLALMFFDDLVPAEVTGEPNLGAIRFNVHGKGITGEIATSWCKEGYRMPETGLNIQGKKGTLNINDDKVMLQQKAVSKTWYRQDLEDNVPFLIWAPEYYREDQHYVNSIVKGTVPNPSFSESSKVDWLIEKVKNHA